MKIKAPLALRILLPTIAILAAAELGCRLAYNLRYGRSIQSRMKVVPHDQLVFRANPELGNDPLRVPPEAAGADKFRIWVLGSSTSQKEPHGNDWPTEFEKAFSPGGRARAFVVNMAVNGYGSSQLRWLYDHYRDEVRPDIVVVFDGWNFRGAMTTPYAYVAPNVCSPFSGRLRCASAWLMRHSTAYALLASGVMHRRGPAREEQRAYSALERTQMEAEGAAWELELRALLADAMRRDRTFLVLFPGLAMREDARAEIASRRPSFARNWDAARFDYELRMSALLRVAADLRVPTLDARGPYLRLPPARFAGFFTDAMHQTPEGNRFLAEVLSAELRKRAPRGGWTAARATAAKPAPSPAP